MSLTKTKKKTLKRSEKRDEDKAGKSLSPEKEAKPSTPVETSKLELPVTPKSSHKGDSFKRKLEADNIVVTTNHVESFACWCGSRLVLVGFLYSGLHVQPAHVHSTKNLLQFYLFSFFPQISL